MYFLPTKGSGENLLFNLYPGFLAADAHVLVWLKSQQKILRRAVIVQLNDSLTSYSQSDIFIFPNINKIKYYDDREKRDRIKKLVPAGDFEQEYSELKRYVKNFGPENFSQDTQLLLDLARLSQKLGPPGEAVLLYKLVLKHYPRNVDEKQSKVSSTTLTKNETGPLCATESNTMSWLHIEKKSTHSDHLKVCC